MTITSPALTPLPLTAAQLTLWFDETYMDDCGLHTMGDCLDVCGPVDLPRLLGSMQLAMNEADAVRARYRLVDNRPVQELTDRVEIPVHHFGFDEGSTAEERLVQAWDDMTERMDRRMDIARPPLVYVVLYQVAPDRLLILTAMHHIVADGYSRTAMYARWCELFDGGPGSGQPLPPLTTLLEAESSYRAGPGFAADERHWEKEVASLPERVSLSVGGSEPGRSRLRETISISPAQTRHLRERVEAAGLTWNSALTGISVLYTSKFSGREHVQVTFPVTARTTKTVRRTVGMMANYPPLAVRVDPGLTVESFIRSVGRAVFRTLKHQRYRVQSIRGLAGFNRSDHKAFGPYVNVLPKEAALQFGEATATLRNVSTGAVDDLMFTFMEAPDGGLNIHVNGNPALHSAAQVQAHATRLSGFLREALSDPTVVLANLVLLPPDDPARADDTGPVGRLDGPGVVESIHRVAELDPARAAIRDDLGDVTYLDLAVRADAVARRLHPGGVAAIVAPPGRDFVVSVVAALQAGAAWTPIDTDSPPERQCTLIADSGASAILTTHEFITEARKLAAATGVDTVIQVDRRTSGLPSAGGVRALATYPANPGSVAYVMFTSGTTGRPKGAMVHRAGLLNHLRAKVELLDLGAADVVMQNAPVTFDVSIWQMLAPLLSGGVTRPVTRATAANPTAIAEIIASAGLTHLELVPSFLRVVLEYYDAVGTRPFATLKSLMVTGEALPVELSAAVHARYPSLPVINAYGPTECSDDVAHAVLAAGGHLGLRAPIGVPIRNTRLLVLGYDLLPVPDGVVGELYVAGPCVGPGYLADPVKTAWAFTALPGLAPGQRAYRTGDHVLRNALGELEFVERRDNQVKINGQRIELGEVEAGLRRLSAVADAAASVVQLGGTARLAGHLVLKNQDLASLDTVVAGMRAELASRVSAHLVPSLWSVMDVLPLTAHGKVDRRALPTGAQLRPATASAHAIVRVETASGDQPNERDVSPALRTSVASGPDAPVASPDAGAEGAVSVPLPPTPIQRQLADDAGGRVDAVRSYSQFVRLTTPPRLTTSDMDDFMTRLTQVHPMLTARLDRELGQGWHLSQRSFGVNGWTSQTQGDPESDLAEAAGSLDPERGIVWRAVLDPDALTLLLAIHHLVVDGVSWRILHSDLERLSTGREPQPEDTGFSEWAADQVVAAHHPLVAHQARDLWASDRWQPTLRSTSGASSATWADSRVHTARLVGDGVGSFLASAENGYGVHINDLLITALGLALASEPGLLRGVSADDRIDVEMEGHGRENLLPLLTSGRTHDLGRTVGWFTTNYPVSVRIPAGGRSPSDVRALVADVHEQTSAMLAHGQTYGLSRWLCPGTSALAGRPVPSIGVNYLGRFPVRPAGAGHFALQPATSGGDVIGTSAPGAMPLRHVLEVTPVVWDTADGPQMVTVWRYDSTTLAADQVGRLAEAWHEALAEVAGVGDSSGAAPSDGPRASAASARADVDTADAHERWRAHLFGLRVGTRLGVETSAPAVDAQLTVVLDAEIAASLSEALASGRTEVHALVHVAWAGMLAQHSGAGEAVFGADYSGRQPLGTSPRLLPLRVRLRPGEDAAALLARIAEELRVLEGAAGLPLADALGAVPGSIPDWVLETAVCFSEPERPVPPVRLDPSAELDPPGAVMTLIASIGHGPGDDFAIRFDSARITTAEVTEHCRRFVESLAALLAGRVPAGLCAAANAGGRIFPRPKEEFTQAGPNHVGHQVASADTIAAVMGQVLGCSPVGPDDGFFALGGDSISVIALVSELRSSGHDVSVQDVYRHRTPRELAAASGAAHPAAPESAAEVPDTGMESLLRLDDAEIAALESELGF